MLSLGPPIPQKRLFEGSSDAAFPTTIAPGHLRRPEVVQRVQEERRMSSTIEEVNIRESLLEVEHDVARRAAERNQLAREIAAQHERLHTLRTAVLEELTKQRRVSLPRWPSGPKVTASLVDEDEWWTKMLGRKRAA
jgi:hypothetical protein